MNEKNLIPNKKRTPRELREITKKGGIRSGQVRRQKSLVRDALNRVLNMDLQTDKLPDAVKKVFNTMDPSLSVADAIGCGLAAKAMTGNPFAAQVLFDYAGHKLQPQDPEPDQDDANVKHTYVECPQALMGQAYYQLHEQVARHDYTYYWLKGGRGSLKSSFISLEMVLGIMANPDTHGMVFRQQKTDLRESVFDQIGWAIDELGVGDKWEARKSPLKYIYKPTGQEIRFRGLDNAKKTKSIKVRFGYFAFIWFEELDEFHGPANVNTALLSVMRGGAKSWVFYSFNPPVSINNWANYMASQDEPDKVVHSSDYRNVPPAWLGKTFLDKAEYCRVHDPDEYRHTYLGIAIGTGGQVFKNVLIRDITDEEIKEFDHLHRGNDWGQVFDPMAYGVMHYDRHRRTLYIFYEYYKVGASLRQLALDGIKPENKLNEPVVCDSAEKRSTKELRDEYGINAINARKGPGSVERGIRFLAKEVEHIVIDKHRCPNAAREFTCYELERDKDGNFKAEYPDRDNHFIDLTRYALQDEIDRYDGPKSSKVDLGG